MCSGDSNWDNGAPPSLPSRVEASAPGSTDATNPREAHYQGQKELGTLCGRRGAVPVDDARMTTGLPCLKFRATGQRGGRGGHPVRSDSSRDRPLRGPVNRPALRVDWRSCSSSLRDCCSSDACSLFAFNASCLNAAS